MRDENKGEVKEAINMYTCAAELALEVVRLCRSLALSHSGSLT